MPGIATRFIILSATVTMGPTNHSVMESASSTAPVSVTRRSMPQITGRAARNVTSNAAKVPATISVP